MRWIITILCALILAPCASALDVRLTHSLASYWQRLHGCEEPGQWHQRGQTYVSGLGIWYGNWDNWAPHVGVQEDHTRAWRVSPRRQMLVAEYGYRHGAGWGCFSKVGRPPA